MQFPLDDRQLGPGNRGKRRPDRHREQRRPSTLTIQRATLISMIGLFMAKFTGFLREMLIVPKFGYGMYSDAYINAFQIPDLIYELLIGGAVAAVLTPTLSSGIERNKERQSWQSVSIFMSVALVVMTVCLLLAELLAPFLMSLITGSGRPDAAPELKQMTDMSVPVMRILFMQTLIMMMVSLSYGVLSAYKRFAPVAIGPSLYNICYMVVLVLFGAASEAGIRKVAFGVVISAMIYLAFQLFSARHELRFFKFSLDIHHPGFNRLLMLAIPTLLSGSVLHINSIVMNRFANGLEMAGAVTGIRQCMTTWGLPYVIFAVSVGNVMLPYLSGYVAARDAKKIRSFYTASLRRALFFVVPFALGFAFLNFETIQAIFQWNPQNYTDQQVALTASALRWFCVSMVAQTVVFLTNQAFYARKITRLALFTGIVALILNPVFCVIFVQVLGRGMQGIAMAHAAYSTVTAVLLYVLYCRHRSDYRPYRMFPFVMRVVFCGGVSALSLLALNQLPIFPSHKIVQLLFYGLKLSIGLLTYYAAGLSIGLKEALKLQRMIRSKLHLAPVEELGRIER